VLPVVALRLAEALFLRGCLTFGPVLVVRLASAIVDGNVQCSTLAVLELDAEGDADFHIPSKSLHSSSSLVDGGLSRIAQPTQYIPATRLGISAVVCKPSTQTKAELLPTRVTVEATTLVELLADTVHALVSIQEWDVHG
jgi:hypothetical protein